VFQTLHALPLKWREDITDWFTVGITSAKSNKLCWTFPFVLHRISCSRHFICTVSHVCSVTLIDRQNATAVIKLDKTSEN